MADEPRIIETECPACGAWVGDDEEHTDDQCLELQRWRADRADERLAVATLKELI